MADERPACAARTRRCPAVEPFLVAAGALVALTVGEWREEAERDRFAADMLARIETELETKLKLLTPAAACHEAMGEAVTGLISAFEGTEEWRFPPEGYRGIEPVNVLTAAQDAAIERALETIRPVDEAGVPE